MLYRQYKYKFYLNMNHSIEMEGCHGAVHPHTWEISLRISAGDSLKENEIVRFSDIEKHIEGMLDKYQDKYLNEVEPFQEVNPTLENACHYFFEVLSKSLQEKGRTLLAMEMSETPARVYCYSLPVNLE